MYIRLLAFEINDIIMFCLGVLLEAIHFLVDPYYQVLAYLMTVNSPSRHWVSAQ